MIRLLLLTALLIMAPPPLGAQTIQQEYEVHFGALRVARLILASREGGGAYSLAGRAESTGLAALFQSLHFEMTARGQVAGPTFRPARYSEVVNTGRRASTVSLRFAGSVPVVDAITPLRAAEPWDVDPADQAGTIDPLSALYRLIRPRPRAELCGWREDAFDGRRRSLLQLGPPQGGGEAIICAGSYRRIAGFPPGEMADRADFPFTARFAPDATGRWRLVRVDLQSLYGPVRIDAVD